MVSLYTNDFLLISWHLRNLIEPWIFHKYLDNSTTFLSLPLSFFIFFLYRDNFKYVILFFLWYLVLFIFYSFHMIRLRISSFLFFIIISFFFLLPFFQFEMISIDLGSQRPQLPPIAYPYANNYRLWRKLFKYMYELCCWCLFKSILWWIKKKNHII